TGHIYGRGDLLNKTYRPHMFVKELKMYVDYMFKEASKSLEHPSEKDRLYWTEFYKNLMDGIAYYKNLFPQMVHETAEFRLIMLQEVESLRKKLDEFFKQTNGFSSVLQPVVA